MTDKKITNEDIARKAFNINKRIKNLMADSEDIKKLIKLQEKLNAVGEDLKSRAREEDTKLVFPDLKITISRSSDDNVKFDVNTFKSKHQKLYNKFLVPKPVVYSFLIK
tara:strand:- start:316 stop:642 length:327 start_codon:yes stop_codon:yes gene_type:complete